MILKTGDNFPTKTSNHKPARAPVRSSSLRERLKADKVFNMHIFNCYIALSAYKISQISLKNRLIQQLIRLKIGSKNLKNSSSIDNILCFHPKNYTRKTTKKRKKRRFHRRFRDKTPPKPPRRTAPRTAAKLSTMIVETFL